MATKTARLPGRLMALDVGDARIGVAVCDANGYVVTPRAVIRRRPAGEALRALAQIAAAEEIAGVVVGLPLHLSGDLSPQAQASQAFADQVATDLGLPVVAFDERFTTVEAERILRAQGVKREQRRARIDAVAAAVILQDYLDAHQPPTAPPPPDDAR